MIALEQDCIGKLALQLVQDAKAGHAGDVVRTGQMLSMTLKRYRKNSLRIVRLGLSKNVAAGVNLHASPAGLARAKMIRSFYRSRETAIRATYRGQLVSADRVELAGLEAERDRLSAGAHLNRLRVVQLEITGAQKRLRRDIVRTLPGYPIYAKTPWQPTRRLYAGERVLITASGTWSASKSHPKYTCGPDGRVPPWGGRVMFFLRGKIGAAGAWFKIGRTVKLKVPQTGVLYLGMRDTDYSDNAGHVQVRVKVLSR